jgi:hypothetical protein
MSKTRRWKSRWKKKEKRQVLEQPNLKRVFYKTVYHFFPVFLSWLRAVDDPRNKNSTKYQIETLLWVGILVCVLKLGSRRRINIKFVTEQFIKHLSRLSKQDLSKIPHNSTLAYLLRLLNPDELSEVRYRMLYELLRSKRLAKFRLEGYYLITLDMTGYLSFHKRHCVNCLTKRVKEKKGKSKRRKRKDKMVYYHPVVDAKLVTYNGFALSVETEFLENPKGRYKKQDDELKAAYRLLKRLGNRFPQLRICLLLDSRYVSKGILNLCRKHKWRYIIVFKKGSAPELYQEYEVLKKRCTDNYVRYEWKKRKEQQQYWWVNNIDYKFEEEHYVNILECLGKRREFKNGKWQWIRTHWVWITNFTITKNNCVALANKGGRVRWKTENEGFKMQKIGGYEMEHAYIEHFNGAKCFYLLMQIAHIINQLMEKGSLLTIQIWKFLKHTIREIAELLLEELRTSFFAAGELKKLLALPIQIRFDTS